VTKRISELPAAASLADTDEFEINQSGTSRKATRGQIVAGLANAEHPHTLADITDSGALAALDAVGLAQIEAAAFASEAEATTGTDNAKLMTRCARRKRSRRSRSRSMSIRSPRSPMPAVLPASTWWAPATSRRTR